MLTSYCPYNLIQSLQCPGGSLMSRKRPVRITVLPSIVQAADCLASVLVDELDIAIVSSNYGTEGQIL